MVLIKFLRMKAKRIIYDTDLINLCSRNNTDTKEIADKVQIYLYVMKQMKFRKYIIIFRIKNSVII
jgi:hypothetical protein